MITKLSTSSITNKIFYRSMLAGNEGFSPDSDFVIQEQLISSTVSSVTFSSIPQTYKHLELRIAMVSSANGGVLGIQFNGETGGYYAKHGITGYNGGATAYGNANATSINLGGINFGTNVTYPMSSIVSIADYSSTVKNKTVRCLWGITGVDQASSELGQSSGVALSNTAISSITIVTGGGNFASGSRVTLYGSLG